MPTPLCRIWLNIGFYTGLTLLTLAAGIFSPAVYLWMRRRTGQSPARIIRTIIWQYGKQWTRLLGFFVPVSVVGYKGPFPEPCIFTPNHQSFFDSYCLGFQPVTNLAFVVRTWPFSIPWYGPYMRKAGYLNSETMNAEEFLREAGALLAEGVSLVIFPEGTRSRNKKPGRFHSGAFTLAQQYSVPIVPLCLDGTGDFLPPGKILFSHAPVRITVLAPVYPESFAEHGPAAHMHMRRYAKKLIEETLDAGEKTSHYTR